MSRKHRATGKKPPGGSRSGSGRPAGSKNVLAYGEVKAVKATKLRLPADVEPESEQLAGRALQRIVDVMEGRVSRFQSGQVLKAAVHVRQEVCGPIAQKHELTGSLTVAVVDPYAEPKNG